MELRLAGYCKHIRIRCQGRRDAGGSEGAEAGLGGIRRLAKETELSPARDIQEGCKRSRYDQTVYDIGLAI